VIAHQTTGTDKTGRRQTVFVRQNARTQTEYVAAPVWLADDRGGHLERDVSDRELIADLEAKAFQQGGINGGPPGAFPFFHGLRNR